jgi:hypothetical protein
MRICFMMAVVFALASAALAEAPDQPTAILVSPIHEAQIVFDDDGKRVEQYYGFGEDVLAVADGTVVYIHDGMPDETPFALMVPKSKSDYGGNNLILKIAPNVFAWYAHLRQGSPVKIHEEP